MRSVYAYIILYIYIYPQEPTFAASSATAGGWGGVGWGGVGWGDHKRSPLRTLSTVGTIRLDAACRGGGVGTIRLEAASGGGGGVIANVLHCRL